MFYAETLPEKVIDRLKNYGVYNGTDKIVAFYDSTIFLSGKKGIICTDKKLSVYEGAKFKDYQFAEIKDLIFKEIDKAKFHYKMILIDKSDTQIDITPGGIPNDEMHLLVDVINIYRKK